MDSKIVEKALQKIGCEITPGAKHRKCRLLIDGVWVGQTTLPQRPKRDINDNWVSQVRTAMRIQSNQELHALGSCNRSREEYLSGLEEQQPEERQSSMF